MLVNDVNNQSARELNIACYFTYTWRKSLFVFFLCAHERTTTRCRYRRSSLGLYKLSTKGQALAERCLETQQGYGLDIDRMRAQGYEGAANMAGIHGGVQAIIRYRVPHAVYVKFL